MRWNEESYHFKIDRCVNLQPYFVLRVSYSENLLCYSKCPDREVRIVCAKHIIEVLISSHSVGLKPRLHQATCCLLPATCCLYLGNMHAYPFISSNRRATNWQQFCCRYQATCWRQHVAWCKRGLRVLVRYLPFSISFYRIFGTL